jgi:hypothetical protein
VQAFRKQLFYAVNENVMGETTVENSIEVSQKIKNRIMI